VLILKDLDHTKLVQNQPLYAHEEAGDLSCSERSRGAKKSGSQAAARCKRPEKYLKELYIAGEQSARKTIR